MEELLKGATLRDLIRFKYETYQELGEKLGWSRQKLNYKLENPESIDLHEATQIAEALGLTLNEEIIQIFLRKKSDNI